MPSQHDPLLGVANARVAAADLVKSWGDEDHAHHVSLRAVVLFGVASASYLTVLFMFGRVFHHLPCLTLTYTALLIVGGLAVSQALRNSEERWKQWLGYFAAGPAGFAAIIGLRIYYSHLLYYDHYWDAKVLTNVPASQPAGLFADAGLLGFSADSRLDVSRSVGYRDARLGATLCVAPIVDSAMGSQNGAPVSLFAAGVDCCNFRGNFHCGDALDRRASSGLLRPTGEMLVGPMLAWAVEDHEEDEGFRKAIELQAAVYGNTVADKVRLLEWSRDPRRLRDSYLEKAMTFATIASLLFFLFTAVAAMLAALGRRRVRAMLGHAVTLRRHAFSRKVLQPGP